MEPKSTVEVEEPRRAALLRLMDALEDHDDVDSVHANFDIAGGDPRESWPPPERRLPEAPRKGIRGSAENQSRMMVVMGIDPGVAKPASASSRIAGASMVALDGGVIETPPDDACSSGGWAGSTRRSRS